MYRDNGRLLTSGDSLTHGDRFCIEVEAEHACHVYVVNEGTSGKMTLLYPRPDLGRTSLVRAGERVRLPSNDDDYIAQGPAGDEKLYFYASESPIDALEQAAANLVSSTNSRTLEQVVATRDIGTAARVEKSDQHYSLTAADSGADLKYVFEFNHR